MYPPLIPLELAEALEAHARKLGAGNEVEARWFLSGVVDALRGDQVTASPAMYHRYYRAGYETLHKARKASGV